jgi:hypothetical protein
MKYISSSGDSQFKLKNETQISEVTVLSKEPLTTLQGLYKRISVLPGTFCNIDHNTTIFFKTAYGLIILLLIIRVYQTVHSIGPTYNHEFFNSSTHTKTELLYCTDRNNSKQVLEKNL